VGNLTKILYYNLITNNHDLNRNLTNFGMYYQKYPDWNKPMLYDLFLQFKTQYYINK